MRLVIIESPYAGNIALNLAYGRAAMRDCLERGEAPYASHLLYTQQGVLRDEDAAERTWGIGAGFHWRRAAHATVFYVDLGVSTGMLHGKRDAQEIAADHEHAIEERTLPDHLLLEALYPFRNSLNSPVLRARIAQAFTKVANEMATAKR